MIKVNLLESITDRPRGFAAVETRVADSRTQLGLSALAVASVLLLVMFLDWMSARSARNSAQTQLEQQKAVAAQMSAVLKEQSELEKKTKDIQSRIDAIQKLRSAQQGPVAVLSAINERIPPLGNFFLDSIEQKGGSLEIKGDSPNEAAVTQFGRSLEFSSGLFTNVNIEIQRRALEGVQGGGKATPRAETVGFTIKCKYTPPVAAPPPPSTTTAAGTAAATVTASPPVQTAQR